MNLKELSAIKSKLRKFFQSKEVYDLILFGSYAKGKALPKDIDVLILTSKKRLETENGLETAGFHLTFMTPDELFTKFPLMMNTILKEGYSLRHNKDAANYFRFDSKTLFSYNLKNLNASEKVKFVNILRGVGKRPGLVEDNGGEWIANQVFLMGNMHSDLFEKLFLNFNIKFCRRNVLIH